MDGFTWEKVVLPLDALRLDCGTQARAGLDPATVEKYKGFYLEGIDLGHPRVVQTEDDIHILVDGFHREAAARSAGLTVLECEVTPGTVQDAMYLAAGANVRHGLQLTREDRRRAVEMAILGRPNLSDIAIACYCGVSHDTVRRVRAATGHIENPTRLGVDGVERGGRPKVRVVPEPQEPEPTESDLDRTEDLPASTRVAIEAALRQAPHLPDEVLAQRFLVEPALVGELREILASEEEEASRQDGVDPEPSSEADGPADEPEQMLDEVGVPIPEEMQGLWRTYRERSRLVLASCRALAQQVNDLAGLWGGEVLHGSLSHRVVSGNTEETRDVSADLEAIQTKLKQSMPHASFCVRCVNEEGVRSSPQCKSCRGRGWISLGQWKGYTEPEQHLAISHFVQE